MVKYGIVFIFMLGWLLSGCTRREAQAPVETPAEVMPGTGEEAQETVPAEAPVDGIGSGTWQERARMLTARSEMAAAGLAGVIYVPGGFGGEAAFEAYQPEQDAWTKLPDLPQGRHHLMATAHGGRVYVFGGARSLINWSPNDNAWAFDPATGEWTELAPMPEERVAGAAVSLGEYVYVVGGVGGSQALLRYDPARDSWMHLAGLAEAREHTAATALDGKLYALAGRWRGVGELTSVEVYDPETDLWSEAPSLSVARGGHAAAVLDGQIYVLGGEVLSDGRETLDSVEIFDPVQGTWTPGPPLPTPLHGVPAVGLEDELFVLGGSGQAGGIQNEGRVFSITGP